MHENLNIELSKHMAMSAKEGDKAVEEQADSVEGSPNPAAEVASINERLAGQLEDAMTLEQKESALARYAAESQSPHTLKELQITTTFKSNQFNLTNNMMNLR